MDLLTKQSSTAYRAFAVGDSGRLRGVPRIIVAADDGEAARAAIRLADPHALELWDGARLVVRVAAHPRAV